MLKGISYSLLPAVVLKVEEKVSEVFLLMIFSVISSSFTVSISKLATTFANESVKDFVSKKTSFSRATS